MNAGLFPVGEQKSAALFTACVIKIEFYTYFFVYFYALYKKSTEIMYKYKIFMQKLLTKAFFGV